MGDTVVNLRPLQVLLSSGICGIFILMYDPIANNKLFLYSILCPCSYCPGGPDSDFEYSTQSYTGYEVRRFHLLLLLFCKILLSLPTSPFPNVKIHVCASSSANIHESNPCPL